MPLNHHIPDIAFYINHLIQLDSWIQESILYIQNKNDDLKARKYDIFTAKEKYMNHFACLENDTKPIGLMVTYNDKEEVCDFCFIPDLGFLDAYHLLSLDSQFTSDGFDSECNLLRLDLSHSVQSLHFLKIMFEIMLNKQFDQTLEFETKQGKKWSRFSLFNDCYFQNRKDEHLKTREKHHDEFIRHQQNQRLSCRLM